jgi:fluoroquinolone transport system permease protein
MMHNVTKLIKGELQRLQKYNVTLISLIVTLIWVALLYFIDDTEVFLLLLPLVIILDVTMMSIMYTGAVMYFEKSENTMLSILVTPVSHKDIIISKIIANVIHQTISTLLVVLAFVLIKDISVSWIIILLMMLSIGFHTLLGFVFTYTAKDFTTMLTNFMFVMIVFATPSILVYVNVIQANELINYLLLISPIEQATVMISSAFTQTYDVLFFMSIILMVTYFVLMYRWYVLPKFSSYVQKGSGV